MAPDRVEAARRLVKRGFSVIPIGDDKRPVVPWLPYQEQHATDAELVSWFGSGTQRNIGIVTGKISGIVVVDTDDPDAETWAAANLPPTAMLCNTAKGVHRYYRHPGTEVRNGARITTTIGTLALDVRGDGGYVVGPGSTHPSGITYTAPNKWPALEDVPVFDPKWIAAPAGVREPAAVVASGNIIGAGQRNATLTSLAGGMQRRGMSAPAITAALLTENAHRCRPPLPDNEVEAIVTSVSRYEPTPDRAEPPAAPALVFINDAELLHRPAPVAVVEDRLFSKSLVTLYGPPGIGKTFVAQDLAYSIASGLPWLGARVMRAGTVVYIAAEGEGGLTLRVRAWKVFNDVPLDQTVGVWTHPSAINLMETSDTQRLIDAMRQLCPTLVVVDTLARCLIGGDENSAKDMGMLVRHCDMIRAELDTIVLMVHHSQKSGPAERGSSALRGACDTMLELTSTNDLLTLTCDKQKDAMPFRPISLALRAVPGTESCVARLTSETGHSPTLTPGERRALTALRECFGPDGAASADWLKAAQVPERSFYRIKKRLEELGYMRKEGRQFISTGKVAYEP